MQISRACFDFRAWYGPPTNSTRGSSITCLFRIDATNITFVHWFSRLRGVPCLCNSLLLDATCYHPIILLTVTLWRNKVNKIRCILVQGNRKRTSEPAEGGRGSFARNTRPTDCWAGRKEKERVWSCWSSSTAGQHPFWTGKIWTTLHGSCHEVWVQYSVFKYRSTATSRERLSGKELVHCQHFWPLFVSTAINFVQWTLLTMTNLVYRCGFSTKQQLPRTKYVGIKGGILRGKIKLRPHLHYELRRVLLPNVPWQDLVKMERAHTSFEGVFKCRLYRTV